jgi:hypothetical protein
MISVTLFPSSFFATHTLPSLGHWRCLLSWINWKNSDRRSEQFLPRGGGYRYFWVGGRCWGKGVGGWIWCKYCVHMYANGKMKSVETVQGMWEGG